MRNINLTVMNKQTLLKMKMYDAVRTVLTENQSVWSTMPAFEVGVNLFNSKLSDVKQASNNQQELMLGITDHWYGYLENIVSRGMILRKALSVYAFDNSLISIASKIEFSYSDLKRANFSKQRSMLSRLYDLSLEYAEELQAYGVTQERILEFGILYDMYESEVNNSRSMMISRKMATETIRVRSKEIDFVLRKRIDVLIDLLKVEYPDFYDKYKNARIVLNAKGKNEKGGESDVGFTKAS